MPEVVRSQRRKSDGKLCHEMTSEQADDIATIRRGTTLGKNSDGLKSHGHAAGLSGKVHFQRSIFPRNAVLATADGDRVMNPCEGHCCCVSMCLISNVVSIIS